MSTTLVDDPRRDSTMTQSLRKISLAVSTRPKQRKSTSSTTSTKGSLSLSLPRPPSITDIYRASTESTLNISPLSAVSPSLPERRASHHRRSNAVDLRLPPTPDLDSPLCQTSAESLYPAPSYRHSPAPPSDVVDTPPLPPTPRTLDSPPCSPTSFRRDYFTLAHSTECTKTKSYDILQGTVAPFSSPSQSSPSSPSTTPLSSSEGMPMPYIAPLAIIPPSTTITTTPTAQSERKQIDHELHPRSQSTTTTTTTTINARKQPHTREPNLRSSPACLGADGLIVDKSLDVWSGSWDEAFVRKYRVVVPSPSSFVTTAPASSSAAPTSAAATAAAATAAAASAYGTTSATTSRSLRTSTSSTAAAFDSQTQSTAIGEVDMETDPDTDPDPDAYAEKETVPNLSARGHKKGISCMSAPQKQAPDAGSEMFVGETVRQVARRRRQELDYQISHKCGDGSGVGMNRGGVGGTGVRMGVRMGLAVVGVDDGDGNSGGDGQ